MGRQPTVNEKKTAWTIAILLCAGLATAIAKLEWWFWHLPSTLPTSESTLTEAMLRIAAITLTAVGAFAIVGAIAIAVAAGLYFVLSWLRWAITQPAQEPESKPSGFRDEL